MNVIKGGEELPPYLGGGFRRSLGCLVQIHISPRQNDIVGFLHLDESERVEKKKKEGESDFLFTNLCEILFKGQTHTVHSMWILLPSFHMEVWRD